MKKRTLLTFCHAVLLLTVAMAAQTNGAAIAADAGETATGKAGAQSNGCSPDTGKSPLAGAVVRTLVAMPEARNHWQDAGRLRVLAAELGKLNGDGLDTRFYGLDVLKRFSHRLTGGNALGECDIEQVWRFYISALADLHFGRIDPQREKLAWYPHNIRGVEAEKKLLAIARAGISEGVDAAFARARPEMPAYHNLRKALGAARKSYPASWPTVPGGPLLRTGDTAERVPAIRQRMKAGGYLPAIAVQAGEVDFFSEDLERAVLAFQRLHGIKDDGVVGPETLREMNIQPRGRIDQVRANLERMRWFSHDIEPVMLLVDIAGAVVTLLNRGEIQFLGRAQAGLPARETPTLKSTVTHVTVNPTWTVPPTIYRNDVLPAVRKDVSYLASRNIRVFDTAGRELNPRDINWNAPGAVVLRQDAGPNAALGRVAIRFPNPFSVYLHDTPNQNLFASSSRFFSSGCVRVENAENLTQLLFRGAPEETMKKLNRGFASGDTGNINLPNPVPLVMFYWTAFADDRGVVSFRPDIYQRDSRLIRLLDAKTN